MTMDCIKVLKVDTVSLNGQGYQVGIRRDDLLVSYNGCRLESTDTLVKCVTESVGDSNEIEVYRSGSYLKFHTAKGALGVQVVPVELDSSLSTLALKKIQREKLARQEREKVIAANGALMEYEYKVIDIADGSLSSALLGEGRIETNVLEAYINLLASEGWRMVFMTKVMQRHLVSYDKETLMVTFERRVPESDRATRSKRCIEDVETAELEAKQIGHNAAVGTAAIVAGGVALGAMLK